MAFPRPSCRLRLLGLVALLAPAVALAAGPSTRTDQAAVVTVHVNEPLGLIDPRIFGHFTEEVLTSYEGGISSELLFNRKFEMPEERLAFDLPTPLVIGTAGGW